MPPAKGLLFKLCRRRGRSEVLKLTDLKAGFEAGTVLYKRISRLLSVQLALVLTPSDRKRYQCAEFATAPPYLAGIEHVSPDYAKAGLTSATVRLISNIKTPCFASLPARTRNTASSPQLVKIVKPSSPST